MQSLGQGQVLNTCQLFVLFMSLQDKQGQPPWTILAQVLTQKGQACGMLCVCNMMYMTTVLGSEASSRCGTVCSHVSFMLFTLVPQTYMYEVFVF